MKNINIYAFADEASPNIDNQIIAMQRNGLSGLEMRGVDGENVSSISLEKAKEVKKKMDDAGLVTWSIGSPIGKIKITDDFKSHLDTFKHTLDVAEILGAGNIRLFSFYIPENTKPEDCKNEVIDRMGAFLETAKGRNINLCHENEKGIYGDIPEHCLELFKALPQLKGIFDPANFVQCGADTLKAWDMLKDYIFYMHIKDSLPDGNVVPAGKGAGNIEYIAKSFIEKGGRDFTMEPHLAVFEGLKDLEQEGEESKIGIYSYGSADEAFDTACKSFKELI